MYHVAAKLLCSDIIFLLSLVAIQVLNRTVLDNAMYSSLLKNAFLPMVIAVSFLNKLPV